VAVSATTRRIRPGERDGEHYHFLSPVEFERRVAAGAFLEHVSYAGNRYGTLRSEIDRILAGGRCPIVEIELAGARAVRAAMPDAVSIFISPPSLEELVARLASRGTDTPDEIAARMATSRVELEARDEFDHTVVNADRDRAIDDLAAVVREALTATPHG
jgi:guanylate kinase